MNGREWVEKGSKYTLLDRCSHPEMDRLRVGEVSEERRRVEVEGLKFGHGQDRDVYIWISE